MLRFQVPYQLKEIPEVQEYLKDAFEQSKNRTDLEDLYRRRCVYVTFRSYSYLDLALVAFLWNQSGLWITLPRVICDNSSNGPPVPKPNQQHLRHRHEHIPPFDHYTIHIIP